MFQCPWTFNQMTSDKFNSNDNISGTSETGSLLCPQGCYAPCGEPLTTFEFYGGEEDRDLAGVHVGLGLKF